MTLRKRSLGLLMAVSAIVGVVLWLERTPFEAALTKPRVSRQGSRAPVGEPQQASVTVAEAKVRLQKMGRMPLYFIENRGQLDSRVAFYVQGRDKTLYFTEQGIFATKASEMPLNVRPNPSWQEPESPVRADGADSERAVAFADDA